MIENLTNIIKTAGTLALQMQKPKLQRISKGGSDFATEADLRVQEQLVQSLSRDFPGIPILGEEDSSFSLSLAETFIIDPIDGTFDYSYGGEEWGILISYFKDGKVDTSVVYQPKLNNLLSSSRHEGSYLNGVKLIGPEVPQTIQESIVIQCLGNWLSESYCSKVLTPIVKKARIIRSFSTAVHVAVQLAKGHAHCFIGEGGKVWDYAPISLLIETLGGVESDFMGQKLEWVTDGMQVVLTFDENLHALVLETLDTH